MKTQFLRELVQVTEWKDGCIYRTKSLGEVWVDADKAECYKPDVDGKMYTSISTKRIKELNHKTIRTVKE